MNAQVQLRVRIAEQFQWIREHGETLAGYIQYYCDTYRRPLPEAISIYRSDYEELTRLISRAR